MPSGLVPNLPERTPPAGRGRRFTAPDRAAKREPRPPERSLVPPEFAHQSASQRLRHNVEREVHQHGWPMWSLVVVGLTLAAFGIGRIFRDDAGGAQTPTPAPAIAIVASPRAVPVRISAGVASPTAVPTRVASADDGVNVVCLDPGHGGRDPGYTREYNGVIPALTEANLNLQYAWDLEYVLQQRGFEVIMTRNGDNGANQSDRDVNGDGKTAKDLEPGDGDLDDLQARINICNEGFADLLVSMHLNGFPEASASGYETWYTGNRPFAEQSRFFAQLAFDELGFWMSQAGYDATPREVMDDKEADVLGDHTKLADRMIMTGPGIKDKIVPSNMPGAIIEPLFISNDADAAFLASAEGEQAIVTAYEQAIVKYFERYPG
jgi:N-acetylmuramoyl-L-alanine amidase